MLGYVIVMLITCYKKYSRLCYNIEIDNNSECSREGSRLRWGDYTRHRTNI